MFHRPGEGRVNLLVFPELGPCGMRWETIPLQEMQGSGDHQVTGELQPLLEGICIGSKLLQ